MATELNVADAQLRRELTGRFGSGGCPIPERREWVPRLMRQGFTQDEIGRMFGVGRDTIRLDVRYLKDAGSWPDDLTRTRQNRER